MSQNRKALKHEEASSELVERRLGFGVREFHRRDGGPMRDVLKLHPTSIVSMVSSWKCQRRIYTTGHWERKWAMVFEVDSRVSTYRSQPFTIEFKHEEKIRQYTPDYEVEIDGRRIIVEAKPNEILRDPDLYGKLTAAEHIFERTGRPFKILGEQHLPDEQWLDAAGYIASHGRTSIGDFDKRRLLLFLRQEQSTTLDRAALFVLDHPSPRDAVLSLVLRPRLVAVDMTRPITGLSNIHLLSHENAIT